MHYFPTECVLLNEFGDNKKDKVKTTISNIIIAAPDHKPISVCVCLLCVCAFRQPLVG